MEEKPGHSNLITDLKDLLAEAESFEFHDFKNNKYGLPKTVLVDKLNQLIQKAKDGVYDN